MRNIDKEIEDLFYNSELEPIGVCAPSFQDFPMPDRINEKLSKPDMSLLPGRALRSVARVLMYGAKKHGKESWKTYPSEAYIAAIGRHFSHIVDGNEIDPETGETHYAHIACSALFLDWLHQEFIETGVDENLCADIVNNMYSTDEVWEADTISDADYDWLSKLAELGRISREYQEAKLWEGPY